MRQPGDLLAIVVITERRMVLEGLQIGARFVVEIHRHEQERERHHVHSYAKLAELLRPIPHQRILLFRAPSESVSEFKTLLDAEKLAAEIA